MFSRLRLFPSVYEMVGFIFLAFGLMIAASSRQLLSYYGLNSSGELVHDSVSVAVGQGLGKLDQLSFTASAVTFGVWAVIGLVCFSIVRGAGRVFSELEFDKELSSNRYVHPATFRRSDFWLRVLFDFLLSLLSVAILLGIAYLFIGIVLPIAVTYGRTFLLHISLMHVGEFLLGTALLYVGIVASDMAVRFLLFHGRILDK